MEAKMFRISYGWRGGVYGTVVQAADAGAAELEFKGSYPHVEFISCLEVA